MAKNVDLREYLDNLRALLRTDEARWRIVVERQVQQQALPKVAGTRHDLEPLLWELLIFCLDGHEATPPALSDDSLETARAAAGDGRGFAIDKAAYPRAAVATTMTILLLREVGVLLPPKI